LRENNTIKNHEYETDTPKNIFDIVIFLKSIHLLTSKFKFVLLKLKIIKEASRGCKNIHLDTKKFKTKTIKSRISNILSITKET